MILVVGARGMLGRELISLLPGDVRGVDVDEIDITSPVSVRTVLLTLKPDVVINAAAYTNVDGCEENEDLAMEVNGEGVAWLAMVSAEIGAKLIHVSTDYVFDGNKGTPYGEDDPVNPLSAYGRSKLAGEMNARANPNHLIVRTQWLYGVFGNNFVETMLRLAGERDTISVVDDQIGSPTWTVDVCLAIRALLARDCRGLYHVANSGSCSWNEFARSIFSETGRTVPVLPMATAELGRPAPRPLYSVLDCGKLAQDTGFVCETWQDALRKYCVARKEVVAK